LSEKEEGVSVPGPRVSSSFRPHRYPALQAIVEADRDATETLSDRAGEQIMLHILRGDWPAGTELNSSELAESLGVSRTPLAKALAQLTADGILIQPRKQPAIVSTAAADWLRQTREFRRLLEPDAAARAAGQVDVEALNDLAALAREATPTGGTEWEVAAKYFDFALHLTIAQYCGNQPMAVAIRKCFTYRRVAYAVAGTQEVGLTKDYHEHVAILDAVGQGRAELARRRMSEHLERALRI
jgi:DNA-binding GntR family transcriptional regulator